AAAAQLKRVSRSCLQNAVVRFHNPLKCDGQEMADRLCGDVVQIGSTVHIGFAPRTVHVEAGIIYVGCVYEVSGAPDHNDRLQGGRFFGADRLTPIGTTSSAWTCVLESLCCVVAKHLLCEGRSRSHHNEAG